MAVTIGIGGTYEFITGNVNRAPVWVQNIGMEWIYRILQEPKRLWKRYAIGMIKLCVLSVPLLIQDKLQRYKFASSLNQDDNSNVKVNSEINSDELIILLSKRLDTKSLSIFENDWKQCAVLHKKVIFNFTQVEFIDSGGLGKLVRIFKYLQREQVKTVSVGLVNENIIKLLKVTRTYDFFNESVEFEKKSFENTLVEKNSDTNNTSEKMLITIKNKTKVITTAKLIGRLDAAVIANMDFDESIKLLGDGDYILDLSELTFLDSSGLRFFFYLQRNLESRNKKLTLTQANEMVYQLLKITNLSEFFNLTDSENTAIA